MVVRRLIWAAMVLVLAVLIGGCGGDSSAEDLESAIAVFESSGLGPVGGVDWPEGLPADIPQLAGDITNVMADGSSARMFYTGVTDSVLRDYIANLESLGYELEYIVYETPGSGDRAQERADAGEWDAVRAVKGEYHLKLEFGGGTGTLDISGIPADTFAPDHSWPAVWSGIPAPTHLEISQVMDFGFGDPIVEVGYETDDDVLGYAAELEAAGFETINRSFDQNHELISVIVRSEEHEVTLRTYPGQRLEITRMDPSESLITPSPTPDVTPGGAAPSDNEPGISVVTNEFPDWLPEVPGGEIDMATQEPNGGFTTSVTIGEGHTVAEYVKVLNDAGYLESGTMMMGYVLSDGVRTITIYGDDGVMEPLQIMMRVAVN